MKKPDKPIRGTDWRVIFKARPDLNPLGFNELLTQIRKEQTNDQNE